MNKTLHVGVYDFLDVCARAEMICVKFWNRGERYWCLGVVGIMWLWWLYISVCIEIIFWFFGFFLKG